MKHVAPFSPPATGILSTIRCFMVVRQIAACLVLLSLGGEAFGQTPPPAKPAATARPAVAGQIAPEVLKRVKQATVHVKVGLPNGQKAEGSGFFGIEPGIVLTNAPCAGHVQGRQPPARLDFDRYQ